MDYQAMKKIDQRPKPRLVQIAEDEARWNLKDLSFDEVLELVESHIEGRPDVDTKKLEGFAMRMSRMAWEKERG